MANEHLRSVMSMARELDAIKVEVGGDSGEKLHKISRSLVHLNTYLEEIREFFEPIAFTNTEIDDHMATLERLANK